MWEREWRLPSSDGLSFHYSDIKVVCCPSEETSTIKEILVGYEQNIQFVNTWIEYNEVTDYLVNRERNYQFKSRENTANEQVLDSAKKSVKQMKRTISELERYMSVTNRFREHSNEIQRGIENLRQQIVEREEQIQELQISNKK
jgi:DNA-binding helix-hairpin-helix protein with protein kinase domain